MSILCGHTHSRTNQVTLTNFQEWVSPLIHCISAEGCPDDEVSCSDLMLNAKHSVFCLTECFVYKCHELARFRKRSDMCFLGFFFLPLLFLVLFGIVGARPYQILINAITALSHVLPALAFEDYYEAVLPRLIIPKPVCLLLYAASGV
jgi:hypothetical protein